MANEILGRLFGFRRPKYYLNLDALAVTDLATPSLISVSLRSGGLPCVPRVKPGDEVSPGRFLGHDGTRPAVACPVKGKVVGVVGAPDIRGGRQGEAVLIEPADGPDQVFAPLNPEKEAPEKLWARMGEAGIITDSENPRPLGEVIGPDAGVKVETLIVSALDREPEQSSALAVYQERSGDTARAAAMLGRMAGAKAVLLAVADKLAGEAGRTSERHGVKVLSIKPHYPKSLEPMLALAAGGGEGVRVAAAEAALAALDAVAAGRVQARKVVTFIGPAERARANYRVSLGMRLKDIMEAAGLRPRDGDKVIMGGPLRGYTQYSLDAAVDQGVDAVTLIPSEAVVKWSDEPCVSSGACVSVCPVNLQPQMLARYSEFGLYDRTEEWGVFNCIECGLCAAACVGRRPLLQWIRLAKAEVTRKKAAEKACEAPPPAPDQADGQSAAAG
ncbi:MAG TPA: 4Fe-4S dicluster domain-containing protein [bacterium]|nr:4Fe-4S dicluster domain-containing protein [bacterium]